MLAELAGGDLVGGGSGPNVEALGFFRVHGVQPGGRRPRMIAAAVAPRFGGFQPEAADDDQAVTQCRERTQDGREREVGAHRGGHPLIDDGAVWNVDESQAAHRFAGAFRERGQGGHHRVEERQSEARSDSTKKRAARQRPLGDDHRREAPMTKTVARATPSIVPCTADVGRLRRSHLKRCALDDRCDE